MKYFWWIFQSLEGPWKHASFLLVNEAGKLISRAKVQAGLSLRLISWESKAMWIQDYTQEMYIIWALLKFQSTSWWMPVIPIISSLLMCLQKWAPPHTNVHVHLCCCCFVSVGAHKDEYTIWHTYTKIITTTITITKSIQHLT